MKKCEFVRFLASADSEGGYEGYLAYGGPDEAPEALRPSMRVLQSALESVEAEVLGWAEELGLQVEGFWVEGDVEECR